VRIEEHRPADVPSDAQLEAADAVAGKIETSLKRAARERTGGFTGVRIACTFAPNGA